MNLINIKIHSQSYAEEGKEKIGRILLPTRHSMKQKIHSYFYENASKPFFLSCSSSKSTSSSHRQEQQQQQAAAVTLWIEKAQN